MDWYFIVAIVYAAIGIISLTAYNVVEGFYDKGMLIAGIAAVVLSAVLWPVVVVVVAVGMLMAVGFGIGKLIIHFGLVGRL